MQAALTNKICIVSRYNDENSYKLDKRLQIIYNSKVPLSNVHLVWKKLQSKNFKCNDVMDPS